VEPSAALRRIAFLLERELAETYRVQAFRKAAAAVDSAGDEQVRRRVANGSITDLPGVGPRTAEVIVSAVRGEVPTYLAELEALPTGLEDLDTDALALLAAITGDCHTHSDWSDGGSPIEEMARTCADLGHAWTALTDHSPRLTVARGLTRERLEEQLDVVARVNLDLAPFRLLTGIEVDILDDGSLDQDDDLLARLDVVVASVHWHLRDPAPQMTRRMLAAVSNPLVDVLGHCTGRMVRGKSRPESTFDADAVIAACVANDVAVEVNCRPERQDPPDPILEAAVAAGTLLAIDTDAHAPGQLAWQASGCARVAAAGGSPDRVVTTWDADRLTAWTHR
jgi:putative hydrolase